MTRTLLAAAAALLLCAAAASPALVTPAVVTIVQRGRAFTVPSVQVSHGDTLHFVNDDAFLHQIYVDSPTLKYESQEQEIGQAIDLRIPQPGTFTVLCHIHPKMALRVEAR